MELVNDNIVSNSSRLLTYLQLQAMRNSSIVFDDTTVYVETQRGAKINFTVGL
jgi:hypothetical protein